MASKPKLVLSTAASQAVAVRRKETLRSLSESGAASPFVSAPSERAGVDTAQLEQLLGYHFRRAWSVLQGRFMEGMAVFGLRGVDLSVLLLVANNSGITSRQLCAELHLQPPNLVGLIGALESRGLLERLAHPKDRRALGLHLTGKGRVLVDQAFAAALSHESPTRLHLSPDEAATLGRLLQKIWQPRPARRTIATGSPVAKPDAKAG
jgi:DNA-binding MarR family transcriptional regulator